MSSPPTPNLPAHVGYRYWLKAMLLKKTRQNKNLPLRTKDKEAPFCCRGNVWKEKHGGTPLPAEACHTCLCAHTCRGTTMLRKSSVSSSFKPISLSKQLCRASSRPTRTIGSRWALHLGVGGWAYSICIRWVMELLVIGVRQKGPANYFGFGRHKL